LNWLRPRRAHFGCKGQDSAFIPGGKLLTLSLPLVGLVAVRWAVSHQDLLLGDATSLETAWQPASQTFYQIDARPIEAASRLIH
jgi:hypothetical protein